MCTQMDTVGTFKLLFAVLAGLDHAVIDQQELNYAWRRHPEGCRDAFNLIADFISEMYELNYRECENIDRISCIEDIGFSEDLAEIDRALIENDFRGIRTLKIFKEVFDGKLI